METFTAKRTPDGNLEFDRGAKSETEGTKWKLRQSEGQNGNSPINKAYQTHTHGSRSGAAVPGPWPTRQNQEVQSGTMANHRPPQ